MKRDRGPRLDGNWLDSPVSAGILLIIMMLVAGLVGCAAPIEGKVIGKDYDPPRSEQYTDRERYSCGTESYTTTQTVDGKSKTVTKSRTKYCHRDVRKTRQVPADWDITIRADDGEEREVDVSERIYNRIRIGDRVDSGNLERVNTGNMR